MPDERADLMDMDAHIVEPGDLYVRYIEPRRRDNAIRVERSRDGFNHFVVKGRAHGLFPVLPPAEPGMWSRLEQIPPSQRGEAWIRELQRDWTASLAPPALDPHARLAYMDENDVDVSLLFPTLGLSWEEDVLDDTDYTYAHLRAYNTWITEFCSVAPRRLLAAAHVSLLDPEAAVREIERTAKRGARAVLLRPVAVGGRPPSDPCFDPVWAAVQDHDLLLALHIFAPPRTVVNWGRLGRQSIFRKTLEVFPNVMGLSDLMLGGVFSRFPRLRVGCIEINSEWLPYVLDNLDEKVREARVEKYRCDLLPSEIFWQSCWITPHPTERFGFVARHVPMDRMLFSTDYPHSESEPDVIPRWRETISSYGAEAERTFLRQGALACLGDPDGECTGRPD